MNSLYKISIFFALLINFNINSSDKIEIERSKYSEDVDKTIHQIEEINDLDKLLTYLEELEKNISQEQKEDLFISLLEKNKTQLYKIVFLGIDSIIYGANVDVNEIIKHNSKVLSVNFSPDGKYVVSTSTDKSSKILELETRKEKIFYGSIINCVSLSKDNKYVLVGLYDCAACLKFDEDLKVIKRFHENLGSISSAKFSSDDKYILIIFHSPRGSYSEDCASLYLTKNFELVKEFNPLSVSNGDRISAMFSNNSKYIFSACDDGNARLWNIENSSNIYIVSVVLGNNKYLESVALTSDNNYALVNDANRAYLWDIERKDQAKQVAQIDLQCKRLVFSNDNKYILSEGSNPCKLWDIKGQLLQNMRYFGEKCVCFYPNSSRFFSTIDYKKKELVLWDLYKQEMVQVLSEKDECITCFKYSDDGKFLLSGAENGSVKLYAIDDANIFLSLSLIQIIFLIKLVKSNNIIDIVNNSIYKKVFSTLNVKYQEYLDNYCFIELINKSLRSVFPDDISAIVIVYLKQI